MKKVIKILILIILPVLAGFGIGLYGYARYQNYFFPYYMEKASQDNTEDRLVSYLKFSEANVESEKKEGKYNFYYSKEFSNENGKLFKLSIIRSYKITTNKAKKTYNVSYHFAIYDINYDNVAKTLDSSNEHPLLYTELPTFAIKLVDANDSEKTKTLDTTTIAVVSSNDAELGNVFVYDYGYAPKQDSKGNDMNAGNPTSMRYYRLEDTDLETFSTNINVEVVLTSHWTDADSVNESVKITDVPTLFNNKYNNKTAQKDELDTIPAAYNRDIEEAGYFKYVLGHYIWWEVLIAVALVGALCAAFVIVWSADESEKKK